jgi:hypothetical protein
MAHNNKKSKKLRSHGMKLLSTITILCTSIVGLSIPSHARNFSRLDNIVGDATNAKYVLESGAVLNLFAKETCSCLYIDGLDESSCKERDNLPSAVHIAIQFSAKREFNGSKGIEVHLAPGTNFATGLWNFITFEYNPLNGLKRKNYSATAIVNPKGPQFGCMVIDGAIGNGRYK